MTPSPPCDRGQVQFVDVLLTLVTLVGAIALAPFYYQFIGMVSDAADPLTTLLLQITMPLLYFGLILGVATSARRGA